MKHSSWLLNSFNRPIFLWFTRPPRFMILPINILGKLFTRSWNLIDALDIRIISADVDKLNISSGILVDLWLVGWFIYDMLIISKLKLFCVSKGFIWNLESSVLRSKSKKSALLLIWFSFLGSGSAGEIFFWILSLLMVIRSSINLNL